MIVAEAVYESSAPTINSQITTHGQISGSFTSKEVDSLVNILRAGALPATLKPQPVSESTMGATLGQDTIQAGVTAVLYAFMAVLAFMIFYYRFAGLVASVLREVGETTEARKLAEEAYEKEHGQGRKTRG